MADIASISAILSSIKVATDIAKGIREGKISLEQAEYKYKLAELIEALADAKLQIASIQDFLLEKDNRIRDLEEDAEIRAKLDYEEPFYWINKESGRDGPYCQQCYDSGKKLIRLQPYTDRKHWHCMTCKGTYVGRASRI